MTNANKPQMHWSHLAMLSRCGVQYEFRYIKGIIKPPAVALIVGSSTHDAVGENMSFKKDHGKLLTKEVVQQIARDSINKRWGDGVELDAEEKEQGEATVRGEAVDVAVALSSIHHDELAPSILPAHIERKWVLELQGFPVDLAGTIDLQETKARDNVVRDLKTASKSPPAGAANNSDQLTMYSLAVNKLDKVNPPVALDYLVKTKVPKAVSQFSERTPEDHAVLLRRIEAAVNAIQKGAFIPAPQDHWLCSQKFCGFWSICPYARKRVFI